MGAASTRAQSVMDGYINNPTHPSTSTYTPNPSNPNNHSNPLTLLRLLTLLTLLNTKAHADCGHVSRCEECREGQCEMCLVKSHMLSLILATNTF
jgi:hypothetical protein